MNTTRRAALIATAAFAAALVWYCSRPCIHVASDTLLWSTEYDASRQTSTYPGPGVPAGHAKAGSCLRVVWTAEGKDYRAYFVLGPQGQKGWVLFGQEGLAIPRADSPGEPNYRAGGDAGTVLCLHIRRPCPGAPHHGC